MYRRTQVGRGVIWSLTAGLLVSLWCLVQCRRDGLPALIFVGAASFLIASCLALFSTMTVAVDSEHLSFFFTCGWPKKTVALKEIASCSVVPVPWWWGYGIRLTPRGVAYRISGTRCVEVRLTTGYRFLLGSDEPDLLCQHLSQRICRSRQP